MTLGIVRQKLNWRILAGWIAAIFIAARAILPMDMMMPRALLEITICSAHGAQTILLDQDMNRADPSQTDEGGGHCGPCMLVFALAWAIALTLSVAMLTPLVVRWRHENARLASFAYCSGNPRAPPFFS